MTVSHMSSDESLLKFPAQWCGDGCNKLHRFPATVYVPNSFAVKPCVWRRGNADVELLSGHRQLSNHRIGNHFDHVIPIPASQQHIRDNDIWTPQALVNLAID